MSLLMTISDRCYFFYQKENRYVIAFMGELLILFVLTFISLHTKILLCNRWQKNERRNGKALRASSID